MASQTNNDAQLGSGESNKADSSVTTVNAPTPPFNLSAMQSGVFIGAGVQIGNGVFIGGVPYINGVPYGIPTYDSNGLPLAPAAAAAVTPATFLPPAAAAPVTLPPTDGAAAASGDVQARG